MKIIVAPDSFKGSLTSVQASKYMRDAILDTGGNHTVINKPMADGGEGTIDALFNSVNGKKIPVTCTGALGDEIQTEYIIADSTTAIIECASIAGLNQVPPEKRNPDLTTTYGIGEVMIDALNKGCTSIRVGIGGSATNDGGLGMLIALGMEAWDISGGLIGPFGKDLFSVQKISLKNVDARIKNIEITVACDVENPLCGELGGSIVYGSQKGATSNQIQKYDQALNMFGDLMEQEVNRKIKHRKGAGAAGGLGFALLAFDAKLVSGAEFLSKTIHLEDAIKEADLVITGEGQSDEQTLYGKAPSYIANIAKKYHVPTILISGGLTGNLDLLRESFAGCFSIVNGPLTLDECIEQAGELLYEQTKQVVHMLNYLYEE